ncbi:uncharacterized protein M421DRAFT_58581 [Didymella exigua CBS 183.55]|uniref:Zn(2)-C6 fungal-type domain-containing protein n=1 Tax=Didymella exigua CBS 183.55 TaxID=1150837 RepID=A0A6A5RQ53_9PLEO|nr:uncharacterized protein M421DRAFT_58581 [Didymella exigua CBS 183.55]KAF1930571.1 hypothetical protein M421DRAFT_58581 [Didymella exigua CBS 183.55]
MSLINTDQSANASEPRATISQAESRPRKRSRITVACAKCRRKKSRCDGLYPNCSSCAEHGFKCAYSNTGALTRSSAPKELTAGLESQVAILREQIAKLTSRVDGLEGESSCRFLDSATVQCRGVPIDPTPLTCSDPNTALEAEDPTDGIGSVAFTEEEHSAFFGPTSNIAFTRQIIRTTNQVLHNAAFAGTPISLGASGVKNHVIHVSRPLSPGPDLLSFAGEASIKAEPFLLPPTGEMTSLIGLYFTTTGLLYPFIDRRKFLESYRQMIDLGISSVRRSWLGLLNMIFAIATSASWGHDPTVTADARTSRSDSFYRCAVTLSDRQIRYVTSLEVGKHFQHRTTQMLLLTSMYLQGTEYSVGTWNVHGLAVKAAYQLGLHSPDDLGSVNNTTMSQRTRNYISSSP